MIRAVLTRVAPIRTVWWAHWASPFAVVNPDSSPNRIRLPGADLSALTTTSVPARKIAQPDDASTFATMAFAVSTLFANLVTAVPSAGVRPATRAIHSPDALPVAAQVTNTFYFILIINLKKNKIN